ncbi:MAG: type II secretion system F family protein [Collinsella bouchesdurhonensis]|nr:type II secretion system F family protein [Collinsella bouchesdurhonensis]
MSEIGELSWRGKRPFALYSFTERLGALVLVVFAAGVLGLLLAWSPWGVLFAIVPPVVLCLVRSRRLRDRARRLEVAMPEAFGSLAISLASGYSLPQAMRFVGARSAEPIRTEFMRVSFAVNCGVPATEALDAMLERLDAPGLELVVLALKVSKRTGAPLGELLREAAQLCHERLELKRMLDVKTSQARMSARLVAGMPAAMVAFLTLLSTDFRAGLATTVGAMSIAVALTLNAGAWVAIRKIMHVEV